MKISELDMYADYYEKTKYQLTLRLSIAVCVMLAILGVTFIIFEQDVIILNFIGLILCSGIVTLILLTKKYKIAAVLFTVTGGSLTIFTLISLKMDFHFVDPLWMLIVSLFAYFTLGKIAGNIAIFTQFLAVVYYLIFKLTSNLDQLKPISIGEQYSIAVNAFLCATVIAYLIHQFLKRNAYAADQYRKLTHELQVKNELVESQNQEKTAMLKEIHHRVKNNLQVITSLLRLQSRDMTNEESIKHFQEAIDRIGTMALIHNQMYQSKDLDHIRLEPYLESLSKNILNSYSLEIPVEIEFDIQLTHTPSNFIVPIALMFNELISNSLKHAFTESISGKIRISIKGEFGEDILVIYNDNGSWQKPKKEDSFGLELIDTLAQQLNGTAVRTTNHGTKYEFRLRWDRE